MPLISVIIPFYTKTQGLLKNSVSSALSQSVHDIEVIVVDDCSPVSAVDELAEIKDERLKVVKHSKNQHGGIARNTGVKEAEGKFIAFLDYDDVWYANKLQKQYELFISEDNEHNSKAVIYSKCKIIDGKREFTRPRRKIEQNEPVGDYLFCAQEIIQTSGLFLTRELALEAPFDNLKRHQDYQFCLSLEAAGAKFVLLDEIVYDFIQIPKQIDYNFALSWLENYKQFLSVDAMKGFKYLVVIRAMIAAKEYKKAMKFSYDNKLLLLFFKALIKRTARLTLKQLKVVK
ncbi:MULTISPECIES: glycosyltransferase family 2 protein [unclassified Pseudoalteromonas]|uniref:glycosyltransferase family 2 protein n=1 Tax=unclassified Pseudoalteromonas TaxID=194690 RepID=UPI00257ACB90|nr:glycosyltransferase family 2 protein [Pseudoalteromonas sp.]|tara:strand:+ start:7549 stop:8412 length:864 start_codon:yes stop_codon:yes gene_type:complete